MIDFIYKMKNSTPTLSSSDAAAYIVSLYSNANFVLISVELEQMKIFCSLFIESLARIKIGQQDVPALQPLHVLSIGDSKDVQMLGLVYDNGCVLYAEDSTGKSVSEQLFLFVDSALVKAGHFGEGDIIEMSVSASDIMNDDA